jgi:hypothetical protein
MEEFDERDKAIISMITADLCNLGASIPLHVAIYAVGQFLGYFAGMMEAFSGENKEEIVKGTMGAFTEGIESGNNMWESLDKDKHRKLAEAIKQGMCDGPCPDDCPEWDDCDVKMAEH